MAYEVQIIDLIVMEKGKKNNMTFVANMRQLIQVQIADRNQKQAHQFRYIQILVLW